MSSPPRQPHLVHVFPSFTHGGVPIRITTVINGLGDEFRHSIVSLNGDLAAADRLDGALGVRLLDPRIDKRRPFETLARIRRHIVDLSPDLLITYNWGSIEWALVNRFVCRRPHLHFESGFGPEEADRQIPRRVRMRRVALARSRALVVPSQTLVRIARDIWRLPESRIRYIANGVDCALYDVPGDPSAAPGYEPRDGELIVGTLAPLRVEKNLPRLLRTFAAAKPARPGRLLIAGDGAVRGELEDGARSLGIADRVIFTGHVDRPERVYPLFDVFAITSDTEQMPNTVIQAMAASRPVAGVDAGDIKVNLSPENREIVVAREDEAGFTAMLERLLNDEGERQRLGAANRRHVVETYSADRMFANYRDLYHEAVSGAARSPAAAGAAS